MHGASANCLFYVHIFLLKNANYTFIIRHHVMSQSTLNCPSIIVSKPNVISKAVIYLFARAREQRFFHPQVALVFFDSQYAS